MTFEVQQQAAEKRWLESWLSGPTRTRWSELPPQVGDLAPNLSLPDSDGVTRKLGEFWRRGPALVLFLRHFGCSCLADRWEKLKTEIPEYRSASAEVVAVGQAEPERTKEIIRRRGYPFMVLCDPSRNSYTAYGLLEGTPPALLHDFAWRKGDLETGMKRIESRRGTERALVDSPWQLPGEFVVAPNGRIVLAYRYQYCEDFPPKDVLLGAINSARKDQT